MNFLKAIFILSIVVLLGSILVYQYVDVNDYDDYIISGTLRLMDCVGKIDSFFNYFHISGFTSLVEKIVYNVLFYTVDSSGLKIERKEFDGVEVFLFDPIKHESSRPAIIYIHGGGFTLFSPKFYSHFLAEIARRLNILIVAVNYRKSPIHPFPLGVTDALTATKYFLDNCERFDVNPGRIALMGDSAGGNMVVAVGYQLAVMKEQAKGHSRVPKILVPLNPAVQIADTNTPSALGKFGQDLILSKRPIALCFCMYAFGVLPSAEMTYCIDAIMSNSHLNAETIEKIQNNIDWARDLKDQVYKNRPKNIFNPAPANRITDRLSKLIMDPRFSPLSALNDTQLAVMPPVYVLGATFDPFRDESKLLAARLTRIGRIGKYTEFDHYHVSFLFAPLGIAKSQAAVDAVVRIFEGNAIL